VLCIIVAHNFHMAIEICSGAAGASLAASAARAYRKNVHAIDELTHPYIPRLSGTASEEKE
jgi:hypothetical protein